MRANSATGEVRTINQDLRVLLATCKIELFPWKDVWLGQDLEAFIAKREKWLSYYCLDLGPFS